LGQTDPHPTLQPIVIHHWNSDAKFAVKQKPPNFLSTYRPAHGHPPSNLPSQIFCTRAMLVVGFHTNQQGEEAHAGLGPHAGRRR